MHFCQSPGARSMRPIQSQRDPALCGGSSFANGLACSCPDQAAAEKRLWIEGVPPLEHVVDDPSEFMGDDGHGFCLFMFADQPFLVLFGSWMPDQEEDGGLGESPF